MKTKFLSILAISILALTFASGCAAQDTTFDVNSPTNDLEFGAMPKYPYPLLHQEWKDFLALSEQDRRSCFINQGYRKLLAARWWKSPNPDNMFIGKEYEQWITEDIPPRVLNVPGVVNFRDIGGLKCEGGKRIRQGLIFRCGEFNNVSYHGQPGRPFINFESKKILETDLGVKIDMDIRSTFETAGMTGSPIGEDVHWMLAPFGQYQYALKGTSVQQFKVIFSTLCNPDNLPVAIHCIYGRDRTGTLCFLLEGILGVSDDDKLRDWEASAFWFTHARFVHGQCIDGLIGGLKALYRTENLNEACVAHAKACGVTDEEIQTFRQIMLEADK